MIINKEFISENSELFLDAIQERKKSLYNRLAVINKVFDRFNPFLFFRSKYFLRLVKKITEELEYLNKVEFMIKVDKMDKRQVSEQIFSRVMKKKLDKQPKS
jgi:hypothetical protein